LTSYCWEDCQPKEKRKNEKEKFLSPGKENVMTRTKTDWGIRVALERKRMLQTFHSGEARAALK